MIVPFKWRWVVRTMFALMPALMLLSSFLVLGGCKTGTIGRDISGFERIVAGTDTKDTVYRRFGVPDDVFPNPDGGTLMVYQQQKDVGMTMGGGYGAFPILLIGHSHVGTDMAYVITDANGVVKDVGIRKQSELAVRRMWPFGE